MSTTVSLPNAHRNRILVAGSALVAAAAVSITLALPGANGADQFHHFR